MLDPPIDPDIRRIAEQAAREGAHAVVTASYREAAAHRKVVNHRHVTASWFEWLVTDSGQQQWLVLEVRLPLAGELLNFNGELDDLTAELRDKFPGTRLRITPAYAGGNGG
ncbi:hypothetical protein [Phenylobacterium sp.]|uniref:hypothetical protein n=1 Tax=Phenylobacterium sp. TaxID=1871053 RepID=UPI00394E1C0C